MLVSVMLCSLVLQGVPFSIRRAFGAPGTRFHVAPHAQICCYTRPEHRPGANGENQEPPRHSHDGLGYQNAGSAKESHYRALQAYTPTGKGLVCVSVPSDRHANRPCSKDINPVYQ